MGRRTRSCFSVVFDSGNYFLLTGSWIICFYMGAQWHLNMSSAVCCCPLGQQRDYGVTSHHSARQCIISIWPPRPGRGLTGHQRTGPVNGVCVSGEVSRLIIQRNVLRFGLLAKEKDLRTSSQVRWPYWLGQMNWMAARPVALTTRSYLLMPAVKMFACL